MWITAARVYARTVAQMTVGAFSSERRRRAAAGTLRPNGGAQMKNTWELMAVCLDDAARAEQLASDLGFRRELRVDPQRALEVFELRSRPAR
jgi:hypothetical protein